MKTLRAYKVLIAAPVMLCVPEIILILLDIYSASEGMPSGVSLVFLIVFVPVILWGLMIRSTHWIQYGNGKLIIRRVAKELVHGRPVGKWQNREDEILLEEIELYGWSVPLLGRQLEYPRNRMNCRGFGGMPSTAIFFKLKNGNMIEFELAFYTRGQGKELLRYIYDGTGINMTMK